MNFVIYCMVYTFIVILSNIYVRDSVKLFFNFDIIISHIIHKLYIYLVNYKF